MKRHPCDGQGPKRQAVVLIHGMGEQRPMQTVRGFVEAVWDRDLIHTSSRPVVWSKPDFCSGSLELRRLTTDYDGRCARTDFFEFYWAHLMEGTRFAHVLDWMKAMLGRLPWQVPKPLLGSYFALCGVLLLFVVIFLAGWFREELDMALLGVIVPPAVLAVATGLYLWLRRRIFVPVIGDAARYLSPNPHNVKVRHEIRTAAMSLLRQLHDEEGTGGGQKYDRIIIVGHSLGSVIGYDVLTHLWPDFNRDFDAQVAPENGILEELEELAARIADRSGPPLEKLTRGRSAWCPVPHEIEATAEQYRTKQREYFATLRDAGSRWRITDFVTLGSPLTHADVIIADDPESLAEAQTRRELPTCPPTLEEPTGELGNRRFSYIPPEVPGGDLHATDRRVPHHAAVFAPVAWTNLYFPSRALLWGDMISGPLGKPFGYGIRDVALEADEGVRLLSHTKYWVWQRRRGVEEEVPKHLRALREALDLQRLEVT